MSRRKANRPDLALPEANPLVNTLGFAKRVGLEPDEKVIIKEVPAKVDGVVVGIAQLYDDGSWGVVLDEDAPKEQIEKIGGLAAEYGFSLPEVLNGSS